MTERKRDTSLKSMLVDDTKYRLALGTFIEMFSNAEIGLFFLLQHFAKVTPEIGNAVFSGARSEQIISFIRRIWQVNAPGEIERKELEEAFFHMKLINDIRNDLVHLGTDVYEGEGRIVSNWVRALTQDHINERRVSPEMLHDMSEDSLKIGAIFSKYAIPESDNSMSSYLTAAWKYIPPSGQRRSNSKAQDKD